jgi:hypothetical protein
MTNTPLFPRRRFLARAAAATLAAASASRLRRGLGDDSESPPLVLDAGFPGGNILVERVEGDDVYLRQDPRDTEGWWFYWYFRVRGAAGRTLAFHFTDKNVFAARGPAVSTDGGDTWAWLGADRCDGAAFGYTFPAGAEEVRFCLAMPYLEADLHRFLDRHRKNPHLVVEHHATTRKGRKNERLRLGRLDGEPEHRVLLTCRHHACEMMASWALEGIMEAVLADTDDGRWFREHVEFLVVPLMDKDGVEDGDQGKNRKPHDHNRDYLGESIYPSVAALREYAPKWSRGKLRVAVDMHCPWIRGGGDNPSSNERVFFVGNPDPETWQRQQEFSRILHAVQTGPLAHHPRNNLPWGQAWNTLKEARSCSRWTAQLPGVLIGTTIEIPYADVAGTAVTVESARALGHDLAAALRKYLQPTP